LCSAVLIYHIASDVLQYIVTHQHSKLKGRSEWGMYERGHCRYCSCFLGEYRL